MFNVREASITTVAVMQPYFMPYAGYFRLFAAADLFVIHDCVPFPRRGWVHRNRLLDAHGALQWLTLPLAAADVDTAIADLSFRSTAKDELDAQMRRFPVLSTPAFRGTALCDTIRDLSGTPVDYLERTLRFACDALGIRCETIRSSTLGLSAALRGQDRIIATVRALGGRAYLNSPGGTGLCSSTDFESQGIELRFLPPWHGDFASLLQRLPAEPARQIAQDIRGQCAVAPAA